jgi:hypothetical protein
MKKTVMAVCAVMMIGFALTTATGFAADKKYSGFLGDYYKYLHPGPEGGAKEHWLKPKVPFGKYNKVMVDSVIFYFAEDSEDKGIDAEEMKELSEGFNQAIVAAFKDKYPIIAAPGPDVLRIKIAITNLKKSKPGVSAVTTVLPVGLGVSLVKKGVSGSYSGSGAIGAEVMTLDSVSNDVIAVAVDEQTAGFTERFSKLGFAKEAFKFWAERIVGFIDDTRGIK